MYLLSAHDAHAKNTQTDTGKLTGGGKWVSHPGHRERGGPSYNVLGSIGGPFKWLCTRPGLTCLPPCKHTYITHAHPRRQVGRHARTHAHIVWELDSLAADQRLRFNTSRHWCMMGNATKQTTNNKINKTKKGQKQNKDGNKQQRQKAKYFQLVSTKWLVLIVTACIHGAHMEELTLTRDIFPHTGGSGPETCPDMGRNWAKSEQRGRGSGPTWVHI